MWWSGVITCHVVLQECSSSRSIYKRCLARVLHKSVPRACLQKSITRVSRKRAVWNETCLMKLCCRVFVFFAVVSQRSGARAWSKSVLYDCFTQKGCLFEFVCLTKRVSQKCPETKRLQLCDEVCSVVLEKWLLKTCEQVTLYSLTLKAPCLPGSYPACFGHHS